MESIEVYFTGSFGSGFGWCGILHGVMPATMYKGYVDSPWSIRLYQKI